MYFNVLSEYRPMQIRCNANTRIHHFQLRPTLRVYLTRLKLHRHTTLFSILDRIAQQINQNLSNPMPISLNHNRLSEALVRQL